MLAVDAARHTAIAVDADSYYILAVEEASFIVFVLSNYIGFYLIYIKLICLAKGILSIEKKVLSYENFREASTPIYVTLKSEPAAEISVPRHFIFS